MKLLTPSSLIQSGRPRTWEATPLYILCYFFIVPPQHCQVFVYKYNTVKHIIIELALLFIITNAAWLQTCSEGAELSRCTKNIANRARKGNFCWFSSQHYKGSLYSFLPLPLIKYIDIFSPWNNDQAPTCRDFENIWMCLERKYIYVIYMRLRYFSSFSPLVPM